MTGSLGRTSPLPRAELFTWAISRLHSLERVDVLTGEPLSIGHMASSHITCAKLRTSIRSVSRRRQLQKNVETGCSWPLSQGHGVSAILPFSPGTFIAHVFEAFFVPPNRAGRQAEMRLTCTGPSAGRKLLLPMGIPFGSQFVSVCCPTVASSRTSLWGDRMVRERYIDQGARAF